MTTGVVFPKHNIISLSSQWVEGGNVRVKVRRVEDTPKIIVDLFVLSPEGMTVSRTKLSQIARDSARLAGAETIDYTLLRDFSTERKLPRLDGSITVTNIHEVSYAF